ncbi:MAG TPA: ATP-binding cassette domain-containing protein [Terriglobales bacterium]|nr:ATP-binding cassette domain-containing protein [Terriglobales bacterium]
MQAADPILRAEHLTRRVGELVIVNDVSLELRRSEVLAVVGPSGSGKTSLLRLINRLDEPTSGTVFVEAKDYREIPPRELRRQVGMVTQRAFLFPGTVTDNVQYGPEQKGEELPAAEVTMLLEKVGLPGYAQRDVTHLSGGEMQRVSLARALANRPCVLLLDEPTSALDEKAKQEVETLFRDVVRQNGLAAILVTHDQAQAARLGSRIGVIEKGRLVKIGTPQEVLSA